MGIRKALRWPLVAMSRFGHSDRVPSPMLGLSPEVLSVYKAVLHDPGTPVDTLAVVADKAPDDVVDALRQLEEKGLLTSSDVGCLVPQRPDVALVEQLLVAERAVVEQQEAVLEARRMLNELVETYVRGSSRGDRVIQVERIDGNAEINRRLRAEKDAARQEISGMCCSADYTEEEVAHHLARDRVLLARGVKIRSLMPEVIWDIAPAVDWARRGGQLGDEFRTLACIPLMLVVIDRSVAFVPVDRANSRESALVVRAPVVVDALSALFDHAWAVATPMFPRQPRPSEELSSRERELLLLLGKGVKDEAAARHLGCSVRTVRREQAALLSRLGARTRFQAGVLAMQRGWI